MPYQFNSRDVLLYLNQLGYTNISAQQLKDFVHDLKKLIKYERRHKELSRKFEQQIEPTVDISIPLSKIDEVFSNLYQNSTVESRAKQIQPQKRPSEIEIQVCTASTCDCVYSKKQQPSSNKRTEFNTTGHISRGTTAFNINDDVNIQSRDQSPGRSLYNVPPCTPCGEQFQSTVRTDTTTHYNPLSFKQKSRNPQLNICRPTNVSKSVRKKEQFQSTDTTLYNVLPSFKTKSSKSKDQRLTDSSKYTGRTIIRSEYSSASNKTWNETMRPPKEVAKKNDPTALKPTTSVIRTAIYSAPKTDPVTLYHQYQAEWAKRKLPGEDNRADLRWSIRERMARIPKPRQVLKVL